MESSSLSPFASSSSHIDSDARIAYYRASQPDVEENHNHFNVPSRLLEKWKWLAGVENNLDKRAQENYNELVQKVEAIQVNSIIELKEKIQCCWHVDRELKDYEALRANERDAAKIGIINRIFFACVTFVLKRFYKPSESLHFCPRLEERSKEIFAEIGGFSHNGENYKVVAFHLMGDENSSSQCKKYVTPSQKTFDSISYGKTYIGIFSDSVKPNFHALDRFPHTNVPTFGITLGRERLSDRKLNGSNISDEFIIDHHKCPVSNSPDKRHLVINSNLQYRDITVHPQGSDRTLDQKLTQVMVEMTMQNNVNSLRVTANRNDFPMLVDGGFQATYDENTCFFRNMKQQLSRFRSVAENNLFPPATDYGSMGASFKTATFKDDQVGYSRGPERSWSSIIAAEPILKLGAAILPEYWAVAPNIQEA